MFHCTVLFGCNVLKGRDVHWLELPPCCSVDYLGGVRSWRLKQDTKKKMVAIGVAADQHSHIVNLFKEGEKEKEVGRKMAVSH